MKRSHKILVRITKKNSNEKRLMGTGDTRISQLERVTGRHGYFSSPTWMSYNFSINGNWIAKINLEHLISLKEFNDDHVNPRPGLSHLRPGVCVWGGRGGSKWPRDLTQKLRGMEMRGKKRSIALNEYNRKCFSHFFARVNIGAVPYYFSENMLLSQNLL